MLAPLFLFIIAATYQHPHDACLCGETYSRFFVAATMNDSSECFLSADAAFGPAVQAPCRDGFDFTFTFEQYFLTVAPCALLLVLGAPRVYYLSRMQPKVDGKSLKLAKLVRAFRVRRAYC